MKHHFAFNFASLLPSLMQKLWMLRFELKTHDFEITG
jgi:hypothetical protein